MKKKSIIILLMIVLAAIPAMSSVTVDGLHLKSINGETVLKVDVGGPFQYSHQIEEAKDGKPYRIIVDIFPATHNLGQKVFGLLPGCIITAIRTSQFSVKPDKIVRVVLDLKDPSIYRIEKSGNFAFVYIPDSENSNFVEWTSPGAKTSFDIPAEESPAMATQETSTPAITAEPVVSVTQEPTQDQPFREVAESSEETATTEEKQIAASEAPFSVVPSPLEEEKINNDVEPVRQPAETPTISASYYHANQSSFFEQEMAEYQRQKEQMLRPETATTQAMLESTTIAQNTQSVESPAVTSAEPTTPVVQANMPQMPPRPVETEATPESSAASTTSFVAVQIPAENKPVESSATQPQPAFDSSVVDAYVSPDDMPAIALPADSATDSTGQRPTSRFRREPNFPTKLKGTLVAEFPQRMVIEYAPGVFRDPFETLIDETKQSDGPTEERIPDVETSRLVGVLETETGNNRALLEDIDGFGYILKQGDKVKKGYVDKIDIDKAFFQLFEYGWSRTIALYLGHN